MGQVEIDELRVRVTALERQVAELKAANGAGTAVKDWRSTLGMFSGDEVMKQIDEEARKIREADREQARRRFAKHKPASRQTAGR